MRSDSMYRCTQKHLDSVLDLNETSEVCLTERCIRGPQKLVTELHIYLLTKNENLTNTNELAVFSSK